MLGCIMSVTLKLNHIMYVMLGLIVSVTLKLYMIKYVIAKYDRSVIAWMVVLVHVSTPWT